MAQGKKSNNLKLFNRNTFPLFYFLILFILCLTIMGLDYRYKISNEIKAEISIINTPVNFLINLPETLLLEVKNNLVTKELLEKKIKTLEQTIYFLSIKNQANKLLRSENRLLRNKLKINKKFNIVGVNAEIILPNVKSGYGVITINKGIKDKIRNGAPVINNNGLVGQIINSTKSYSEIKPLTSIKFAVPAIKDSGKENVILYGNGNGELEIPLFPARSKLKVNDIFMTSGIDKIYPKGINIGKVIAIEPTKSPKFNNILIQPFSQPTSYSQITVLKIKKND